MRVSIEVDEATLRHLVREHITRTLGEVSLQPEDISIEVKSKQNYRSEWESAAFRARVQKDV